MIINLNLNMREKHESSGIPLVLPFSLDVGELLRSLLCEFCVGLLVDSADETGFPSIGEEAHSEPKGHWVGAEEGRDRSCHLMLLLYIINSKSI